MQTKLVISAANICIWLVGISGAFLIAFGLTAEIGYRSEYWSSARLLYISYGVSGIVFAVFFQVVTRILEVLWELTPSGRNKPPPPERL
jgi:hypothetical protein